MAKWFSYRYAANTNPTFIDLDQIVSLEMRDGTCVVGIAAGHAIEVPRFAGLELQKLIEAQGVVAESVKP